MPEFSTRSTASARDLIHIDQAAFFFLYEIFEGFGDLHLALLGALAKDVRQDVLEVDIHLFDALVGDDLETRACCARARRSRPCGRRACLRGIAGAAFRACVDAIRLLGEGKASVLLDRMLPALRRLAGELGYRRGRRQQQIEQTFFGVQFGLVFDFFELFFAHHVDGDLDEVAHNGFDVAADVADFGELRGFDFEEGRVGQLGQTAGDFGFAYAGGPDHDDVFGHDLVGEIGRKLLAAHAIAQRDGDGALGGLLADDVLVQLGDDFARGQIVEREFLVFRGSR